MQRSRLSRDGGERLGGIEVLAELPLGRRRELARLADELVAEPGETIVRQGDPGYEFMLIEDGQADVLQDGRVINTMGAGDCFGELAVLSDGKPRSASVVASTRVRAIVMTAHFTRELHRRVPDAASRIDAVAAERVERDAQRADAQG